VLGFKTDSGVLNIAKVLAGSLPQTKPPSTREPAVPPTESTAVLDVCRTLTLITPNVMDHNKTLLKRIEEMLTRLIKSRRPT
jgi:hypothetical protein